MPPTAGSKKYSTIVDSRLPTCRNYWRFGNSQTASPPQRPPSYLLKPHLIASSATMSENSNEEGCNPNSKYYKLRHGPGAGQFSPLNDEVMNYQQYRVRLPFDPTPFRGVTRFAFWILFLSILIILFILITALLRVDDFHVHGKDQDQLHGDQPTSDKGTLRDSLILKTLLNRRHN